MRKARQRAEFGDDADRYNFAHAAQSLQRLRHFLNLTRRHGQDILDGFFQPLETISGMFHFVHVIEKHRLQRRLLEAVSSRSAAGIFQSVGGLAADPGGRPRARVRSRANVVLSVGNRHGGKIAGAITARQF
jgi:hypothetical protein